VPGLATGVFLPVLNLLLASRRLRLAEWLAAEGPRLPLSRKSIGSSARPCPPSEGSTVSHASA
jgi:hypothetical protein